jgi:hypothetical protein
MMIKNYKDDLRTQLRLHIWISHRIKGFVQMNKVWIRFQLLDCLFQVFFGYDDVIHIDDRFSVLNVNVNAKLYEI